MGLITCGDESAYWDEVQRFAVWCARNNLSVDTLKTKEMVIDYKKSKAAPAPLYVNGNSIKSPTSKVWGPTSQPTSHGQSTSQLVLEGKLNSSRDACLRYDLRQTNIHLQCYYSVNTLLFISKN